MIKKFRRWLRERFLPEYCRQQLLEENEQLRTDLARAQQRLKEQGAYIEGMQDALHTLRRITIQNTVGRGNQ